MLLGEGEDITSQAAKQVAAQTQEAGKDAMYDYFFEEVCGGSAEEEARLDEEGAAWGDPRVCPRHPHFAMSSPDGMFDGWDCGPCEAEYEAHSRAAEVHAAWGCTEPFDDAWVSAFQAGVAAGGAWWAAERAADRAREWAAAEKDDACPF